jgi:hypothetical protein
VVTAVRSYTGGATMRDLIIDTTHTYYVLAGNTPVLVHNCDWTSPESLDSHFADHGTDWDTISRMTMNRHPRN